MSDPTARARAALEGVTPGPWEPCYHPSDTSYPSDSYAVITALTGDTVADGVDNENRHYDEPHGEFGRDAQFIAAARQLVPELIAEVERLQRITDIIDPDSVYREQRDQARARLAVLEQAIARVRELHRPYDSTKTSREYCRRCAMRYPCPTIRALDGTDT